MGFYGKNPFQTTGSLASQLPRNVTNGFAFQILGRKVQQKPEDRPFFTKSPRKPIATPQTNPVETLEFSTRTNQRRNSDGFSQDY